MEDDIPASSSSFRARDEVFCHETARRAVARAALHLGLDAMSVEACDSLAAVLIAYLERIGRAVATTVEASGRSSAHANILDALRAIEECTEPAVTAVFTENASAVPQAPEITPDPDRFNHAEQMSWKGLAAFCFGKQWREPLEKTSPVAPRNRGRGGKGIGGEEGEDTAAGDENVTADEVAQSGWRAPYPEEVVPFPVASAAVANPHNLPEDILALEQMPDTLFASNGERKRSREEGDDRDGKEPPTKRSKMNVEAADTKSSAGEIKSVSDKTGDVDAVVEAAAKATREEVSKSASTFDEDKHRPWYFPKHWPSYPRKEVGTQALVLEDDLLGGVGDEEVDNILGELEGRPGTKTSNAEVDPTRSVRSALVQMGWGTMRDTNDVDPYELRVAAGARLDAAAGGGARGQIVPLGKASNARVNKILEGSMESGM